MIRTKEETIADLLTAISQKMKTIPFKRSEEDFFASIMRMRRSAMKQDKYFQNLDLFIRLLGLFVDLLYNQDSENYMQDYMDFDKFLYEAEDYLYTEIFESTHEYDKAIDKVTNILENRDDEK